VSSGHAVGSLHHPGATVVHRLPPEAKVAATVLFMLAVVATPREAVWALAAEAGLVLGVVALARLPLGLVGSRLRIEAPFLAFAVFLPIVGASPRVDVLGVALSRPGLWSAWNIVAKGSIGVLAAIVLAATTSVPALLAGLQRLHVPRAIVEIAGFMARYLDVIAGEAARMRIARLSRAHDPRWIWQGRAFAASVGTLFVRAYERGERVHFAMAARGYTGTMPELADRPDRPGTAWHAFTLPTAALALMAAARLGS